MIKKEQKDLFSETPQILSVSDYIKLINANLEVLRDIFVEGEVSEFRISKEKWVSFKLKDEKEKALIECFMVIFKLNVPLEDGMKIRVQGKPRIYPAGGRFSINIEYIELSGEGTLKKAFELTKAKLQAEGLFAQERKRPIPEFPNRIGLITSPDAAAYTDFLKIMRHRFGGIKIYFYPARVQGKDSIQDIVRAFDWFNQEHKKHNIELIVLTRGGGALEDLQTFNSEEIARAVFSSKIPVICGVGHERDECLADFVADLRASTPSNAAELIVRDRNEVKIEVNGLVQNIEYFLNHSIEEKQALLNRFLINSSQFIKGRIYEIKQVLLNFAHCAKNLSGILNQKRQEINFLLINIEHDLKNKIVAALQFVNQQKLLLKSYNPQNVLKRGYGIIRNKNGKIIKTVEDVSVGESIETKLYKGSFVSKIKNINN
ncbi:exodeoxyribonuclease VII large subunit [bacterium]|nr:MAG: exodeoxyribonuclease VII large subunit [bacterium]